MKSKDFIEQATKYKRYFNMRVDEFGAERSVKCKAGRLEIYAQLYDNKLSAHVFTHPVETAFETEVLCKKCKTVDEAVKYLKATEEKYKKMKTWCPFLYKK
ncbi:MAG: hypothetical protein IK121_06165 [Lachnospiraceae bacterium]|nr:hypothetical protein [Lachnospiraceae bacterium]